MPIKVIITGSTGMVGEGLLHACIDSPDIERILVINRKTVGIHHPKLKEIIHPDFSDFSGIEAELTGYDVAYLCIGVTSAGKREKDYTYFTYDLTMALARPLLALNPEMTICYVSGMGTDSTEKGRVMWARVKGRTENALLSMGFKDAYMIRPGFIRPLAGAKNTNKLYTYLGFLIPVFMKFFPRSSSTMETLTQAMIQVGLKGTDKRILEVMDLKRIAPQID